MRPSAAVEQVAVLVQTSRRMLIDAYGTDRVVDLLRFIDQAFAVTGEPDRKNGISVRNPEM